MRMGRQCQPSRRPHVCVQVTPHGLELVPVLWVSRNVDSEPLSLACLTAGLNRIGALEPIEPVRRYERAKPGEMIHIDIKKLGKFNRAGHRATGTRIGNRNRGVGWEFVHVAIDDASRIAFSRVLPSERQTCAATFLKVAIAYYKSLGITVERVMTDNGSCYRSRRFRNLCRRLGLKLIYTRPYTPRTNGKAERFIQTALREWAYAKAYQTSRQRAEQLPLWLQGGTVFPSSSTGPKMPRFPAFWASWKAHASHQTEHPPRPGRPGGWPGGRA